MKYKFPIYQLLLAILLSACGQSEHQGPSLLKNDSIGVGEPRKVPFPVFGCKEEYRQAAVNAGLDSAWEDFIASVGPFDERAIDHGFDGMIVYIDQAGKPPQYFASGWHDRNAKIPAKPDLHVPHDHVICPILRH